MKTIEETVREIERRKRFHRKLAKAASDKGLTYAMEANDLLVKQMDSLLNFIKEK